MPGGVRERYLGRAMSKAFAALMGQSLRILLQQAQPFQATTYTLTDPLNQVFQLAFVRCPMRRPPTPGYFLCGCKVTANQPRCDGVHSKTQVEQ